MWLQVRVSLPTSRPIVLIVKSFMTRARLHLVSNGGMPSYTLQTVIAWLISVNRVDICSSVENLGNCLLAFLKKFSTFSPASMNRALRFRSFL